MAIYIDFESVKAPGARPALLGILLDATFRQVILDEQLWPAAVAQPQLRCATLEETVAWLVGTGLPILGWSLFDCEVVTRADIDAKRKDQFAKRYINALTFARAWRATIHPRIRIEREGRFDPKHTLDRYADLARYSHVAKLRGAKPATWIRHLQAQLASRTHYRRVTPEAKRDWHKLLDYNRHDCLALRHVYERATFELRRWRAYHDTSYCVRDDDRRPVCFRIRGGHTRMDALLDRHGSKRWAFLTAWNPKSQRLAREDNERRQAKMTAELRRAGYRYLPGEGRGADASWPPEESVLVLDISESAARATGRRHGQFAIVVGQRGESARLVACT